MIEHGINTYKADYMVHFFPLKLSAFSYLIRDMRSYLDDGNGVPMGGR